jgi:Asp-tRNA(Asn)/Glu-tRNA(Gln) amidotransferase A subunit family amidase
LSPPIGPLNGLTVGVKDVFDTSDQPTEYGSPIYAGHRPRSDAAAVALLRKAGAVVLGKTVTTELAWFTPGPTVNPHRHTHTPGGSSSGSAAAVATGMVDIALGTQTAGSIIRPASFCGVFGYKPTFGLIPTAGVKQAAPSLDTVGLLAANLDVLDAARCALTGRPAATGDEPVRFALVRTDQWSDLTEDGRAAVEEAAARVSGPARQLPDELLGLADQQPIVQAYEGARALAWERQSRPELLSPGLRQILDRGDEIRPDNYDAILRRATRGRCADIVDRLFGDADVAITPAVPGEAPEGLASTGDPRFCRLWTLLGFPALCVPGLVGATGMPIGIQLVARPHDDGLLIRAGRKLAAALA